MLLKCYTQYVSKFGNLSSSHRTRKGQFSFQSQRRKISNNVQTIVQLYSFHKLASLCSKLFILAFSNMWTKNLQIYKLGFKEAAEPEIVLPTFFFLWIMEKGKEFQKSIYFCFTDYAEAFDCVDYNKLWKILKKMGIPDHLTCMQVK